MVQLVALVCCVALIYVASLRMPAINKGREQLDTMGVQSPVLKTDPQYAFAVQALGAFRGLITDLAFIRAETYKEQGRFYDAVQLAKWICALQPRFPTVWEFAAWNMSWNISVTTYTPEERWNWVYNGVRLLRDQGIPANPRAVNLYKQLAWTFNNKMGEIIDDYHVAYKCNWAWRMHLLLGAPTPALGEIDPNTLAQLSAADAGKSTDLLADAARKSWDLNEEKRRRAAAERGETYVVRRFEELKRPAPADEPPLSYLVAKRAAWERIHDIAVAPATLDELYQREPNARPMVEALRVRGVNIDDAPLTEDAYWSDRGLAFTFFAPYRRASEPASVLRRVTAQTSEDERERQQAEQIGQILGLANSDPAGVMLVRFLQKKVLHEVYALDADHMAAVVDNFGPMDWRSVDAHALYWVTRGLIAAGETMDDFRNDKANTARIMFFCLRNLFLRNRMVFEPYPPAIHRSYLNLSLDTNFVEPMHQAYIKYGNLFDPRATKEDDSRAGDTYRTGHINYLTEAIRLLYLGGQEAEADHYYAYLQRHYPNGEDGQPNPRLAKTLHDFVMDDFFESTAKNAGLRETRAAVEQLLSRGFSLLANGDVNGFTSSLQRARELHENYMRDKRDRISAPKQLPEFDQMLPDAFYNWLAVDPGTPLETLHKARLWGAAPIFLRQAVWDYVQRGFELECQRWSFDMAQAFPEPPEMEAFRKTHPERYRPELRDTDVQTLPQKLNPE